jgi:ABC-type glycerol-3-phosphate transport system substrate-binding protein
MKVFFGQYEKSIVVLLLIAGLSFSSCTKKNQETSSTAVEEGTITVLTNRNDVEGQERLKKWAEEFDALYSGTQRVLFETVDDYENQVKIRMSTNNYGDVLLIPNTIEIERLGEFFLPLGSFEELSKKYVCIDDRTYDNLVYGIPVSVQFTGIFYNKAVFAQAGITTIPRTRDEFIAAMHQIKRNTKAIPNYSCFKDGWLLNQWEASTMTASGSPDWPYVGQSQDRNNFLPGSGNYELYKLMYELAAQGLNEEDPSTSTFDEGVARLDRGDAATIVCSSWAIRNFTQDAPRPEDIGYMPYPVSKASDTQYVRLGRDYVNGASIHTKYPNMAKAWIEFFAATDYATDLSTSLSPLAGGVLPDIVKEWYDLGVVFAACTPALGSLQGQLDRIDKESEVGLLDPAFKHRIIEAAIGNRKESYDDIMQDLNRRWTAAMDRLGL